MKLGPAHRGDWLQTAALAVALLATLIPAPISCAQSSDTETTQKLEQQAIDAFYRGEHTAAEELLRRQAELDPASPVPRYNLACVLASTQREPEAIEELLAAIDLGFADKRQIQQDPHLAPLRGSPEFEAILRDWATLLDARSETTLEAAKQRFGRGYTYERDEWSRLLFISGYTPTSFDDAKLEIQRVTDWATQALPGMTPEDDEPAWVSVILPKQADFRRWAVRTLGVDSIRGTTQVGGLYDHDTKELWAADLGGTLRHEFFHVLHWRSMSALGQRHPTWAQEGLASLVETIDQAGRPVPCWRTNLVRRHARTGSLIPIERFTSSVGDRLHRTQPLRFYAQARAVCLFLLERGSLDAFYQHLSERHREDPTALSSLLAAAGVETPRAFDAAFRSWALGLPEVPEALGPGDAALGVRVDVASTGEGLEVTGFPGRRPAGLRVGDVITHVADRPARDFYELVRIVSGHRPGEEVAVRYRRRDAHGSTTVRLQRVGPGAR